MDAKDSIWRVSTLIYRVLVAGQTIAWALGAVVIRFVLSQPGGLMRAASVGQVLATLCVAGLVASLVTYAFGPKSYAGARRGTIILTWGCLQASGLLALVGYILSGEWLCFAAGIAALGLMHLFGPGRLRSSG